MGGFWHYLFNHPGEEVWSWTKTTLWLGALPVVIGLLIALPIGWLAHRYRWTYPPIVSVAGIIYTIPSLVLFLVLPGILGTGILDPVNVAVALTIYTVALLVRVVSDGLSAVSPETMAAATAMGFSGWQRLVKVQLPLAVPVIGAGLRVAAVSNVSLISVASVVGVTQLGQLFKDSLLQVTLARQVDPAVLGILLFFVIAFAFDLVILLAIRLLTPWQRAVRS
ncbi:ABC transporter permease [Jatrophihabitans sp.]|uniref:ABC transporter permease n=1 Tax=Jatrophihabitans sp. TaxID=1932789 RepID=UPI0030C74A4E|nr:binding-protein-dependent transport system inner rane component [Jatrophihabitans sp.]